MTVLVVLAALFGLLIGSFLNVVIYRVPRAESLITPESHCPTCGRPVRARHNVPVLSWLVLRGRCADCRAPISVRYPLVELATALLFVAVAVRLSELDLLAALPAYWYFTAVGIALSVIDLDHRRLPNVIVLPSYGVIAVLLLAASAVNGDWWALARAGISGAALFGFYLLIALIYPAGMGFGDVKLAGIIGAILGYLSFAGLVVGAFGGFLLGSIVGIAVLAGGRGTRKTALPFGPFMMTAALAALFVTEAIFRWYLHTIGLA